MKSQYRMLFALVVLLLAVSLACIGLTPTQAPGSQSTPGGASTPNSGKVPDSGGVSSLDGVQSATIQIEAQGTFIDPQVGLQVNVAGRGSGFIIDPSGIAVTNNHVVAGSALIKVWVGGESTPRNARILGLSECSDLAVIDIEGDGFPYLNWYQGQVKTGLEVYSAGFPLGEPEFNLTKGIISKEAADGQSNWASLSQVLGHDATINPGNSGGPLVDANGQVVGVNYQLRPDFNQYFAIGGDIAIPVVDEMRSGKDVDSIGVNGTAVLADDGSLSGIWVSSVKSGSSADKAGVQGGDILYQLEGLVLATDGTMKDYCDVIRSNKPDDALTITVIRYASGELLEGQLNGRALAVTGTFDTAGGSSNSSNGASSDVITVEDQNKLYTFDIPANWSSEANDLGNAIYSDVYMFSDTWTSPDGSAVIEGISGRSEGFNFDGTTSTGVALDLLNSYYSSTGREGDIRISKTSTAEDGSTRFDWTSKGGDYSGISWFEVRGTRTFIMWTVNWGNGADQAILNIVDNAINTYQAQAGQ